MDDIVIETILESIDRRVTSIEQILPTLVTTEELRTLATKEGLQTAVVSLATKEELRAAVAPLATQEELRVAVASLATKDELREEAERLHRHMNVVAESLRKNKQAGKQNQRKETA